MNKVPPSPKLMRLDADIKSERDPIRSGCLRAERAGLVGRLGFFDEARAALDALHKEFARNPQALVSIWMQIAEGWIAFYLEKYTSARDHFTRSCALSRALGQNDLLALGSAWLANIAYLSDELEDMGRHLDMAIRTASAKDHLTQTRLCMVLALAYFSAGRYDLAQPWFTRTRNHSVASNDEATLSALNYNMTTRRVFYLMTASIEGSAPGDAEALVKIGVESTEQLDRLLGIALVGDSLYQMQAQFHSACRRHEKAKDIYTNHISNFPEGLLKCKAVYLADSAWCHANCGDLEAARELGNEAERSLDQGMYVEDLYLTYGRLRQLFQYLGDQKKSEFHQAMELGILNKLQTLRRQMLSILSSLPVPN